MLDADETRAGPAFASLARMSRLRIAGAFCLLLGTAACSEPDLDVLRQARDICSDDLADFADDHQGETIEFDGAVADAVPYDEEGTHFDYVVRPGDVGEGAEQGAWIVFHKVTPDDLAADGIDGPLAVDALATFTARVLDFDADNCILDLDLERTVLR